MAETQQVLFVRILLGIPFSLEIRMFLFSGSREETGEGNGTHSSTLAWKIPWTEEPGRLQSMGSRRVGHDWATSLPLFAFMHWRRKRQPIQCSCLETPRDRGAWWAALYGVAQSHDWSDLAAAAAGKKPLTGGFYVLSQGRRAGGRSKWPSCFCHLFKLLQRKMWTIQDGGGFLLPFISLWRLT